jgi:putative glutamine amidotransferase
VEFALERPDLPLLAICRGIQSVNVFAGGTLHQDIKAEVRGALQHSQSAPRWHGSHAIEIDKASRLGELLGAESCRVNSFHHQAVRDVAPGWRVTATAADGVVEAMEHSEGAFRVAVQFHPEWMADQDPLMSTIFAGFTAAARA